VKNEKTMILQKVSNAQAVEN